MSRAKLHRMPGLVWHLTHRCHNRDFLLKFARDKKQWLHWLFEAKKRHRLAILDYTLTSNHIHLMVYDDGGGDVIPRSIALAAGRTAREYNIRKGRSGAFWEDHYHATAVETESHLRCGVVYISLNMVRAGVVDHPRDWPFGGYQEIISSRQRYRLVDRALLARLLGLREERSLESSYTAWVDERLAKGRLEREAMWTDSIAIGGSAFVDRIKERLGIRAGSSGTVATDSPTTYLLKEEGTAYKRLFATKNMPLRNLVRP